MKHSDYLERLAQTEWCELPSEAQQQLQQRLLQESEERMLWLEMEPTLTEPEDIDALRDTHSHLQSITPTNKGQSFWLISSTCVLLFLLYLSNATLPPRSTATQALQASKAQAKEAPVVVKRDDVQGKPQAPQTALLEPTSKPMILTSTRPASRKADL